MRFILLTLFTLLATPAFAQGWGHYDNARFGYGIDIPPGFAGSGESENGDGQAFAADGRPIELRVWGGLLGVLTDDFESEVTRRMAMSSDDGWNLTHQAITPGWASYSGVQGSRILYQRMVQLCDGGSFAAFSAEYSVADVADMDPVIEKLVLSLRGSGC